MNGSELGVGKKYGDVANGWQRQLMLLAFNSLDAVAMGSPPQTKSEMSL